MNVFKYIKDIYSGKDAVFNHISLFSVLGIMTVALNSYAAFLFGNIFGDFMGFAPANSTEIFTDLFIGIILLIFFTGYYYNYVHKISKEELFLPELSLSSYLVFLRMLPLFFVWGIYFTFLFFIGFLIIPIDSFYFHLYLTILLCLVPFVNLVFIAFANDYKYRPDIFNPFIILPVLDKTLGAVIFLTCKIVILSIIPILAVYSFYHCAGLSKDIFYKLALRIFGACLGVYSFSVLAYVYSTGLVKIVKDKLKSL